MGASPGGRSGHHVSRRNPPLQVQSGPGAVNSSTEGPDWTLDRGTSPEQCIVELVRRRPRAFPQGPAQTEGLPSRLNRAGDQLGLSCYSVPVGSGCQTNPTRLMLAFSDRTGTEALVAGSTTGPWPGKPDRQVVTIGTRFHPIRIIRRVGGWDHTTRLHRRHHPLTENVSKLWGMESSRSRMTNWDSS